MHVSAVIPVRRSLRYGAPKCGPFGGSESIGWRSGYLIRMLQVKVGRKVEREEHPFSKNLGVCWESGQQRQMIL